MRSDFGGNTDVSFLLKNLNNLIQRYLHSLYKRKGFEDCTIMNMWISDFIYDNRGTEIYQKDVEAEFSINRATASKMLSLMEKKGLIKRVVSEKDARLRKIELLPKGYELHERCMVIREEIENELTRTLSVEAIEMFKVICRQMITNMEK